MHSVYQYKLTPSFIHSDDFHHYCHPPLYSQTFKHFVYPLFRILIEKSNILRIIIRFCSTFVEIEQEDVSTKGSTVSSIREGPMLPWTIDIRSKSRCPESNYYIQSLNIVFESNNKIGLSTTFLIQRTSTLDFKSRVF